MDKKHKIRWGVLGTANIATKKVIPAIQNGDNCIVTSIASRDLQSARNSAELLGIKNAYGSYDELIANPDIDVVYVPLPNHLHFDWTKKAMKAGKNVLCEKPLVLNSTQIDELRSLRNSSGVKVGEAFMVKTAPQWRKAKEIIKSGRIGELRSIQGFFSYYNNDSDNIRNIKDYGGGALWDIGVYPVFTSRYILDEEPEKVMCDLEQHDGFKTDVLVSAMVRFPGLTLSFTCSTLMVPYQRMNFFGIEGVLEIMIPFNAPIDSDCIIKIHKGDIWEKNTEVIKIPASDQYTVQAEEFSDAVMGKGVVPVSLENTYNNTKVIEALFKSCDSSAWVTV